MWLLLFSILTLWHTLSLSSCLISLLIPGFIFPISAQNSLTCLLSHSNFLWKIIASNATLISPQEEWDDPTNFTAKIDSIAKKLGYDMDKNNSDIKPSTPLDIGRLPVLLKVEKPQLDMSKIPGVPRWNKDDGESGSDTKQGVCYCMFWYRQVVVYIFFTTEIDFGISELQR